MYDALNKVAAEYPDARIFGDIGYYIVGKENQGDLFTSIWLRGCGGNITETIMIICGCG